MRRASTRRRGQSGFALLLVFAMAATIMVMLYLEMPRVAFEHQRNKEGLLVERGEQFMRAIALYHRKFAKLPQNIDELESTNNLRFLRRKYEDPMTGKDEWRLVHVDAAGQYVDSLVHKRQGQEEKKGPSALAATIQGIGSQAEYTPGLGGDQDKNPALQRRASDRIIPGMPGSAAPGAGESGDNEQTPESRSGAAGANNPFEGIPGSNAGPTEPPPSAPPTGSQQPAPPGTPGAVNPGNQPPSPPGGRNNGASGQGATQGGQTGSAQTGSGQTGSGQAQGGGFGFGSSSGFGNSAPQTGGTQQPAAPGGQGANAGFGSANQAMAGQQRPAQVQDSTLRAIGSIITGQQQRPGSGTTGGTGTGGLGGSLPGTGGTGGVVGVASKADFTGILVYNEKTNVKEWEFLYDMKKAAQAGANQQGTQQGNQPGQNPAQGNQNQQRPSMTNPFGNTSGGRTGRP